MTSLRFSTALHVLLLLAHEKADAAARAVPSSRLAGSIGANPVVVRRVLAELAAHGLVETRAGSSGGAWLARTPARIRISDVYAAVDDAPARGFRPKSNSGCPVGDAAPGVICGMIQGMEKAAKSELARHTLAGLLRAMHASA